MPLSLALKDAYFGTRRNLNRVGTLVVVLRWSSLVYTAFGFAIVCRQIIQTRVLSPDAASTGWLASLGQVVIYGYDTQGVP